MEEFSQCLCAMWHAGAGRTPCRMPQPAYGAGVLRLRVSIREANRYAPLRMTVAMRFWVGGGQPSVRSEIKRHPVRSFDEIECPLIRKVRE
jgi:hypothetical protein